MKGSILIYKILYVRLTWACPGSGSCWDGLAPAAYLLLHFKTSSWHFVLRGKEEEGIVFPVVTFLSHIVIFTLLDLSSPQCAQNYSLSFPVHRSPSSDGLQGRP